MQCPVCQNSTLQMSERQGVEIDYCPQCRGVWLDRGELDKIIERMSQEQVQSRESQRSHDNSDYKRPHHKKKRESFLGDFFDF